MRGQRTHLPLALSIITIAYATRHDMGDDWWLGQRALCRGHAPHNSCAEYEIFRDVRDYGAVGDGVADDTAAIQRAIASLCASEQQADGERCGPFGESSTTEPALVYLPPGTYLVSRPLQSYYYTQLVGSATSRSTILAAPSFKGLAVIDEDPYDTGGRNWYTNQNNLCVFSTFPLIVFPVQLC